MGVKFRLFERKRLKFSLIYKKTKNVDASKKICESSKTMFRMFPDFLTWHQIVTNRKKLFCRFCDFSERVPGEGPKYISF